LIENDANRAWDVFVRELATGDLQVASLSHSERPATTALALTALRPEALSADGRYLAFLSLDSNIKPNDTNGVPDAYIYDRVAGTNALVSMAKGIPLGPPFYLSNHVTHVLLSPDGRHAAFTWAVENQQPGLFLGLFWRDLSKDSSRLVATGQELAPLRFGADARLVAFQSPGALDLFTPDSNQATDIFLRWMGAASASPLEREIVAVSTVPDNSATGNGASFNASFSPDGSWIVFQSTAGDLTPTPYARPANAQLMARRLESSPAGLTIPVRLLSYQTVGSAQPDGRSVDKPLTGPANFPAFSTDSRYVLFEASPNLIYRHDLHQDLVVTVTSNLVGPMRFFTNIARVTNTLVCTECGAPSVSGDGRLVAYESRPAAGGTTNLFLKDLVTGQTELVSATRSGNAANGRAFGPLLSHDARYVVFSSTASNLVEHDINGVTDVFVRDRFAGITMALGRSYLGPGTGNRVSSEPILSADGRTVAFQSFASDLVPGDDNDTRDVFVVTLSGPDTDNDGLDDEWEMTYFNTLARDGAGDWDADGVSDGAEYRAGTNPANDQSFLRVLKLTTLAQTNPNMRSTVLMWSAAPGRAYRVQTKTALEDAWLDLADTIVATTYSAQTVHTVTDALPRYYRVRLLE
jgi:Tol biopolymer transport system component